jgi:hypothetical protein
MSQFLEWVYDLDNHNKAAVTAYVAFLQWFHKNLSQDDTQHIAKGAAGCWPCPGGTTEQQICEAFLYALQRVTGENPVNYNTNQCYHKLIRIIYPARFTINTVGFRVYYASMTCSTLISGCISVVCGDEVMAARKIPEILITPFAANRNAQNSPLSDFKFAAAEKARTHLGGGRMPPTNTGGELSKHKTWR